jgi:flagellar biogenesis protein FliO
METMYYLKVFGSLIFVIGLFCAILLILRKIQPSYFNSIKSPQHNIKLEEQLYLDPKHRMVVVRYEDKKYLLLLGESNKVVDVINCTKSS